MKRSAQVVLVVMAATGVGATSYALMPREDCGQTQAGAAQTDWCRSSSGGSGHSGSYSGSPRGSSSSGTGFSSGTGSSSGSAPAALVGGTERGGFGSFARSFASHISGGG